MAKKLLLLVDGSSYLYRAFHALPPLTNSKGQPTGAVYGVVNMLRRLVQDYKPDYVAVVFDAKGKTFRDDMYALYKAHRPPMPPDLVVQIEPLHKIIKAMGLPLLMIDGVEADDVIGTLAVNATNQDIRTVISTGDKDMAQLVNDHVSLVNTMTNTQMDYAGVIEKFGVPPERIIDYLALIGDKTDNVPGVNSCGPKTAVKWLQEYGTLEEVIKNAEKIGGKVGEQLRIAIPHLPLSKQLVTIKIDVPLPLSLNNLHEHAHEQHELVDLFKELEFKIWLSETLREGDGVGATRGRPLESEKGDQKGELGEGDQRVAPTKSSSGNYQTILTETDFEKWLEKLAQAELFAFDTETTSLNYMDAELVGISFAIEAGHAAYVPLAHDYLGAPQQLDRAWVLRKLKPILENPKPKIIGQHIKYDMNVLANYDISLRGIAFDTMLESYCLDSVATRHNMDALALKYLGVNTIKYEDVAGKGAKQINFSQVDIEKATEYAAEDADITLQLHQTLWPRLAAETKPAAVFQELEVPLISVLSKMECTGVLVDGKKLEQLSAQFAKRMDELIAKAYELAGEEFNLDSPKQLQEILFNKLQLPMGKKTAKGQASTAEAVLHDLALDYPLPAVILEYRTVSKLKSTYTDKLPTLINKKTGRIHTSYNQAVASTGRLSSSDPNLQNIPTRSEAGQEIRSTFIAAPGYQLVSADYSQVELRIMAHIANDPGLLKSFANGIDIHRATAAEVFGIPLDKVTSDQRRKAKAINFGLLYGMSAFGLSKQLGSSRHDAQEYVDIYFARYPGVKKYMEQTRELAKRQGYVETLRGRRLYLPEINASNKMRQMAAERIAINAPLQGTAADIIKQAMLDVQAWLDESKIDARMIMQVHDELVLEVADAVVDQVKEKLPLLMTAAADLKVPLVTAVGVGLNWAQAHD
ncbi:MAG: DNA polymerase I [Gammaproteobacteria bacterium]|nr:DNA polymerase I [Gammaproteobacteria bacterium]